MRSPDGSDASDASDGRVGRRTDYGRVACAALFVLAGLMHFVMPAAYRAIVPGYLPAPALLVAVSGAAEIAGGIGLLVRSWRRAAGLGLVVLLVAVLPANVEMFRQARSRGASDLAQTLLWLRLPLQGVLIWWAWRLSRSSAGGRTDGAGERFPAAAPAPGAATYFKADDPGA